MVSTIDFFFPLINDPYKMGKIACANVLSDVYAIGCHQVTTVLNVFSNATKISSRENDVVMALMLRGFVDCATDGDTEVTGGQTVKNQEMLCGGVAMSICKDDEFVDPIGAKEGDVLILTKPIGIQIAVNCHQWLDKVKRNKGTVFEQQKLKELKLKFSDEQIKESFEASTRSMMALNKNAAKLMKKYDAGCSTDVTGFGLINHAKNLAVNQTDAVDFVFTNIPCLKNSLEMDKHLGNLFGLTKGTAAETSGGLIISLPKKNVDAFLKEFEEIEGRKAWVVGKVVKGNRTAMMEKECKFFEVDF